YGRSEAWRGETPELSARLRRALAGFGDFQLVCEGLGCFPDLRSPRVIWAGVHGANERLLQLQHRVENAVAGLALQPAAANFVGHVTLARSKPIPSSNAEHLARFVEDAAHRRFGGWRVPTVSLIHSQRS
ncbi:MAG: RNA 2',3'-cyclic phosphodiesterase, partial [Verrucomicrobia bacterium]|nr:RNA 2',3'-cyclic phosphodiesterase [Verrucomicrobiota bacterium]